jgi:hypothetical protein
MIQVGFNPVAICSRIQHANPSDEFHPIVRLEKSLPKYNINDTNFVGLESIF